VERKRARARISLEGFGVGNAQPKKGN